MTIEIKNLTHIYNKGLESEFTALKNVDMSIGDGVFAGIIGSTGSGKSTLVQHLNGLLKPSSGQILIDGEDITAPKYPLINIRRRVGLVFQYPEYQLFEETVAKDVAFGPENLGLSAEEVDERVLRAIRMVGFEPDSIMSRSPLELSGGQKRRVAIAGVLAMEPDILILDEPTAGLDPSSRHEVLDMIRRIHEDTGNITILITHNMADISKYADMIFVMNKGSVLAEGKPEEVFSRREILKTAGLEVPPVMRIMDDLRKGGLCIPEGISDAEKAAEAIKTALVGE